MQPARRLLLGAGTLLASGAGLAQARRVRLVNAALPPFVMPAGESTGEGIDIELARAALREGAGWELELELMPWRRVLLELEEGRADFTSSVNQAEGRRPYLSFSLPYGPPVRHCFYARRGDAPPLHDPAGLSERRVGVVAGFALPQTLRALLPARLEQGQDLPALLRMLAAGRVDLALANDWPARWWLRRLGLEGRLQQQPYAFDTGRRTHFGVARRRDPAGELLQALDRGLRSLERTRGYARIVERYLGP